MSDNTVINAQSGGDTIRDLARQSGTVKTPVMQLDLGGPTANAEVLITAGQQIMAASVPTVIASNQTPVPISNGPSITNPTSVLTLPSTTTAYAAAEAIASSTTAGSVVVPSFSIPTAAGGFLLSAALLTTNDPAWAGAVVQVDLWRAAPTLTNGDRGAYLIATGSANYLGSLSFTLTVAGDGCYAAGAPTVGTTSAIRLASGSSVFWTAQAVTGTTGTTVASGVFTLTAQVNS